MTKTKVNLQLLLLFGFLIVGYQNCFQMDKKTAMSSYAPVDNGRLDTTKPDCQFVTTTTLRNFLIQQFGITTGDVAIMTTPTQPSNLMYINTRRATLGEAPTGGVSDSSCSSIKYKTAAEIMVNGCSLATATAMQRLFPNGTQDFSAIFRAFLGRNPSQEEIASLQELVQTVSSSVAEKAVCAAVASSLEVLARNI